MPENQIFPRCTLGRKRIFVGIADAECREVCVDCGFHKRWKKFNTSPENH
jgi:hypothetical protein